MQRNYEGSSNGYFRKATVAVAKTVALGAFLGAIGAVRAQAGEAYSPIEVPVPRIESYVSKFSVDLSKTKRELGRIGHKVDGLDGKLNKILGALESRPKAAGQSLQAPAYPSEQKIEGLLIDLETQNADTQRQLDELQKQVGNAVSEYASIEKCLAQISDQLSEQKNQSRNGGMPSWLYLLLSAGAGAFGGTLGGSYLKRKIKEWRGPTVYGAPSQEPAVGDSPKADGKSEVAQPTGVSPETKAPSIEAVVAETLATGTPAASDSETAPAAGQEPQAPSEKPKTDDGEENIPF